MKLLLKINWKIYIKKNYYKKNQFKFKKKTFYIIL